MSSLETLSTAIFDRILPAIKAGDKSLTPMLDQVLKEAGVSDATSLLTKSSAFVPELQQQARSQLLAQAVPLGTSKALKLIPAFALPLAADLFTDVGDAEAAPLDLSKLSRVISVFGDDYLAVTDELVRQGDRASVLTLSHMKKYMGTNRPSDLIKGLEKMQRLLSDGQELNVEVQDWVSESGYQAIESKVTHPDWPEVPVIEAHGDVYKGAWWPDVSGVGAETLGAARLRKLLMSPQAKEALQRQGATRIRSSSRMTGVTEKSGVERRNVNMRLPGLGIGPPVESAMGQQVPREAFAAPPAQGPRLRNEQAVNNTIEAWLGVTPSTTLETQNILDDIDNIAHGRTEVRHTTGPIFDALINEARTSPYTFEGMARDLRTLSGRGRPVEQMVMPSARGLSSDTSEILRNVSNVPFSPEEASQISAYSNSLVQGTVMRTPSPSPMIMRRLEEMQANDPEYFEEFNAALQARLRGPAAHVPTEHTMLENWTRNPIRSDEEAFDAIDYMTAVARHDSNAMMSIEPRMVGDSAATLRSAYRDQPDEFIADLANLQMRMESRDVSQQSERLQGLSAEARNYFRKFAGRPVETVEDAENLVNLFEHQIRRPETGLSREQLEGLNFLTRSGAEDILEEARRVLSRGRVLGAIGGAAALTLLDVDESEAGPASKALKGIRDAYRKAGAYVNLNEIKGILKQDAQGRPWIRVQRLDTGYLSHGVAQQKTPEIGAKINRARGTFYSVDPKGDYWLPMKNVLIVSDRTDASVKLKMKQEFTEEFLEEKGYIGPEIRIANEARRQGFGQWWMVNTDMDAPGGEFIDLLPREESIKQLVPVQRANLSSTFPGSKLQKRYEGARGLGISDKDAEELMEVAEPLEMSFAQEYEPSRFFPPLERLNPFVAKYGKEKIGEFLSTINLTKTADYVLYPERVPEYMERTSVPKILQGNLDLAMRNFRSGRIPREEFINQLDWVQRKLPIGLVADYMNRTKAGAKLLSRIGGARILSEKPKIPWSEQGLLFGLGKRMREPSSKEAMDLTIKYIRDTADEVGVQNAIEFYRGKGMEDVLKKVGLVGGAIALTLADVDESEASPASEALKAIRKSLRDIGATYGLGKVLKQDSKGLPYLRVRRIDTGYMTSGLAEQASPEIGERINRGRGTFYFADPEGDYWMPLGKTLVVQDRKEAAQRLGLPGDFSDEFLEEAGFIGPETKINTEAKRQGYDHWLMVGTDMGDEPMMGEFVDTSPRNESVAKLIPVQRAELKSTFPGSKLAKKYARLEKLGLTSDDASKLMYSLQRLEWDLKVARSDEMVQHSYNVVKDLQDKYGLEKVVQFARGLGDKLRSIKFLEKPYTIPPPAERFQVSDLTKEEVKNTLEALAKGRYEVEEAVDLLRSIDKSTAPGVFEKYLKSTAEGESLLNKVGGPNEVFRGEPRLTFATKRMLGNWYTAEPGNEWYEQQTRRLLKDAAEEAGPEVLKKFLTEKGMTKWLPLVGGAAVVGAGLLEPEEAEAGMFDEMFMKLIERLRSQAARHPELLSKIDEAAGLYKEGKEDVAHGMLNEVERSLPKGGGVSASTRKERIELQMKMLQAEERESAERLLTSEPTGQAIREGVPSQSLAELRERVERAIRESSHEDSAKGFLRRIAQGADADFADSKDFKRYRRDLNSVFWRAMLAEGERHSPKQAVVADIMNTLEKRGEGADYDELMKMPDDLLLQTAELILNPGSWRGKQLLGGRRVPGLKLHGLTPTGEVMFRDQKTGATVTFSSGSKSGMPIRYELREIDPNSFKLIRRMPSSSRYFRVKPEPGDVEEFGKRAREFLDSPIEQTRADITARRSLAQKTATTDQMAMDEFKRAYRSEDPRALEEMLRRFRSGGAAYRRVGQVVLRANPRGYFGMGLGKLNAVELKRTVGSWLPKQRSAEETDEIEAIAKIYGKREAAEALFGKEAVDQARDEFLSKLTVPEKQTNKSVMDDFVLTYRGESTEAINRALTDIRFSKESSRRTVAKKIEAAGVNLENAHDFATMRDEGGFRSFIDYYSQHTPRARVENTAKLFAERSLADRVFGEKAVNEARREFLKKLGYGGLGVLGASELMEGGAEAADPDARSRQQVVRQQLSSPEYLELDPESQRAIRGLMWDSIVSKDPMILKAIKENPDLAEQLKARFIDAPVTNVKGEQVQPGEEESLSGVNWRSVEEEKNLEEGLAAGYLVGGGAPIGTPTEEKMRELSLINKETYGEGIPKYMRGLVSGIAGGVLTGIEPRTMKEKRIELFGSNPIGEIAGLIKGSGQLAQYFGGKQLAWAATYMAQMGAEAWQEGKPLLMDAASLGKEARPWIPGVYKPEETKTIAGTVARAGVESVMWPLVLAPASKVFRTVLGRTSKSAGKIIREGVDGELEKIARGEAPNGAATEKLEEVAQSGNDAATRVAEEGLLQQSPKIVLRDRGDLEIVMNDGRVLTKERFLAPEGRTTITFGGLPIQEQEVYTKPEGFINVSELRGKRVDINKLFRQVGLDMRVAKADVGKGAKLRRVGGKWVVLHGDSVYEFKNRREAVGFIRDLPFPPTRVEDDALKAIHMEGQPAFMATKPLDGVPIASPDDVPRQPQWLLGAQRVAQALRPPKVVLQELEQGRAGKLYTDLYQPIMDSMRKKFAFTRPYQERIDQMLKGTSKTQRRGYTLLMETTPGSKEFDELVGEYGLDAGVASNIRGWFNDLFKDFGLDANRYFTNYVPHLRKSTDYTRAYSRSNRPKEIEFFGDYLREGSIPLEGRELDIRTLMDAYLHQGSFHRFVNESWKKGEELARTLRLMPTQYTAADRFLREVRGETSAVDKRILEGVGRVWRSLGAKEGLSGAEAERAGRKLFGHLFSVSYAAAFSYRMAAVLRQMFQTLQTTYPRFGLKATSRGITRLESKEGRELIEKSGALIEEMFGGEEGVRTIGGKVFRKVDNLQRGIAGLAQDSLVLDHLPTYKETGRWDRFMRRTSIDKYHPILQNQVKELIDSGKTMEARLMLIREASEDTQWLYSRGNRPEAFTGIGGRLFGQFGMYPIYYAEYIRQGLTRGSYQGRLGQTARFLTANTVLYITLKDVFGADAINWLFFYPLTFTGGPFYNALRDVPTAMSNTPEAPLARKRLKQLPAQVIPGYQAAMDLYEAFQTTDGEEMLRIWLLGMPKAK